MEEDKQIQPVKWIQTPFAYTGLSKNLSLLQQNILVKVSAYLQKYWTPYWNSSLKDSKERPKPFMSEMDRLKLAPIRIPLSELDANTNYDRVDKALQEILRITVDAPATVNGETVIRKYNVFSYGETPVTDGGTSRRNSAGQKIHVDRRRGYVDIQLNPDVVNYVLDMSSGYVSHPENIARIGKAENMPQMYYLIRHYMNNWKQSHARIELNEMKDYLGMIQKDENDVVVHVSYAKYSQFKSKVLKRTMDELHELFLQGKIDKDFTFEEERPNGKKTGDPLAIHFTIVGSKPLNASTVIVEEPEQKDPNQKSWIDVYNEKNSNPTAIVGQKAWDSLCSAIKDKLKRDIFSTMKVEKIEDKNIVLYGTRGELDTFAQCFEEELDKEKQIWVFAKLTSVAQIEIRSIVYHYT